MIKITKPAFKKTLKYLEEKEEWTPTRLLHKYGRLGVSALANATPVDSGDTSRGWSYEVRGGKKGYYQLIWKNNQVVDGGAPLILLLQYGHGTRGGTIVSGRDIINPALRPIYDNLHNELVREALQ